MSVQVQEQFEFGGVDSRSNPLNMPQNRALQCVNVTPMRAGFLQVRRGYSPISQDAIQLTPAMHSLASFRVFNGDQYVVFFRDTTPYLLDVYTGHVSTVTVRGKQIISSSLWQWAYAKNMLFGVNGTDMKMLDANGVMRDIGLPDPNVSQQNLWATVQVNIGAADPNGLVSTIGGAQPGFQFYAAIWNRVTGHVSNRIPIGQRVAPTTPSDINIVNLPNFHNSGSAQVTTVQVLRNGHNNPPVYYLVLTFNSQPPFQVGDQVLASGFTTATWLNGQYLNVFAVTANSISCSGSFGGPYGPAPDTGTVSNGGLNDSEWDIMIGRTGDGAEVPYPVMGSDGNWLYCPNGTTAITVATAGMDGTAEMPTRNGPPPVLDKIVRVGDRLMGNPPNSPYIYWTDSEADAAQNAEQFTYVGDCAQAWPGNNVETFQTGAAINCLGSDSGMCYAFSEQDVGILDELSGVMGWEGTWQVGAAGREAFQSTPYGPCWVTGNKQLATMSSSGPTQVSDEYEVALLGKIPDQNLSVVQVRYFRDQASFIDQLVVKALDSVGPYAAPFRIVHDFMLRDSWTYTTLQGGRSPMGQGYEDRFSGVLASDYYMAQVRDGNDHPRLYAGAQDGRIYQLYSGELDDAYDISGLYMALLNAGPSRPKLECLEWFGDGNARWSVCGQLNGGALSDISATIEQVPGGESDSQYRVVMGVDNPDVEVKRLFVQVGLGTNLNSVLDPYFNDPALWSNLPNGCTFIWEPIGNGYAQHSYLHLDITTSSLRVRLWDQDANAPMWVPLNWAFFQQLSPGNPPAFQIIGRFRQLHGSDNSYTNFGLLVNTTPADAGATDITAGYKFDGQTGLWLSVSGNPYGPTPPPGTQTLYVNPYVELTGGTSGVELASDFDRFVVRFAPNAQPLTLALNNPPHFPLESWGRVYMVAPNFRPGRGH